VEAAFAAARTPRIASAAAPDDRTVVVVNGTQAPHKGLKAIAKVYDLAMNEKFSRDATLDVGADGVARSFAIPEPDGISSTYFLTLQLFAPDGQLVSRNFYWLSTKLDVLNFDKTEWYYTPQTDFADFTALQSLPAATVKAAWKPLAGNGHDDEYQVTLRNAGAGLALLVHLRLVKGADKTDVLPIFWEDNYISLLPGERREVRVSVRKSDLSSVHPELVVDGFNVAPETVRAAH